MLNDGPDPSDAPATASAAADRRAGGKRHRSVLLVGRVHRAGGDAACVVHDISQGGLMARFAEPPVIGETLTIEVRGLPPATGTVRWVNGRKAGLQFAEAQPVDQVVRPRDQDGIVARPPRFPLTARATLRIDGERSPAETLDISAGGAKLATERAVAVGETGQVTLTDTGTALFGRVCWVRDGAVGFRFMTPLSVDALAEILGK